MEAVREVLADDSFKIKSTEAIEAREVAQSLLEWCLSEENKATFTLFASKLSGELQQTVYSCKKSANREKMWRTFFLLRSSDNFIDDWVSFLGSANVTATPILYQHISDVIFRKHINDRNTVSTTDTKLDAAPVITQCEGNVLRYAAGYVCRHLRKKIERSKHELREEMVLCLMALTKDAPEDHSECASSEKWILKIDRGGLWHVKETTFSLFISIEEEVRECLKMLLSSNPTDGKREEIIGKIVASDDVDFYWLIVTADFEIAEKEVHDALLKEIVQLYVTIRGFSYASFWVEKYKQLTKKSTQRSKSLRRDLYDSSL